jgi:hypothetical protein
MVMRWRFLWLRVMVRSIEVIHLGSETHMSITSRSSVALERSIKSADNSSAKICYRCKCEWKTNIPPTRRFFIDKDSRVE